MTQPAFWDRIAAKYAARPIADMPAYEAKIERLRSIIGPEDRVLEVGCGTGGTALRLAEGAAHVIATDISAAMIDIARNKLGSEAPDNVEFVQAGVEAEIPGGPFDVICAFSLLHLVDDLAATLEVLHRQLRPGGTFVSKTVCLGDEPFWMRLMVRGMTLVGYAPNVLVLSRADLVHHLERTGFEIVDVTHFTNQRTNPFIIARKPA